MLKKNANNFIFQNGLESESRFKKCLNCLAIKPLQRFVRQFQNDIYIFV